MNTSDIHADMSKATTSAYRSGDTEPGTGLDGGRSTPRDLDISSLTSGSLLTLSPLAQLL